MIVYGKNVLNEIDKKKIKKAYICNNKYIDYLKKNNINYTVVDKRRILKYTDGKSQGIVLDIYDYDYYKMEDIDSDFVVVLDHILDHHNLGAIIRTCECVGITNVIIPKDRSALVNDVVYSVSAGAINNVKIILVSNINNAINKLKEDNYFIYTADMNGEDYRNVDYASKKVLVIGSEGEGVSKIVRDNSDVTISIPMYGKINSLNASVSFGILAYGMIK